MEVTADNIYKDAGTIVVNENGILKVIDLHTGDVVAANNLAIRTEKEKFVYSVAMASVICDYIREGLSFAEIAKMPHMPPYNVFMRWRHLHPDFGEAIKRAKVDRAELYHDRAIMEAENICSEEDAKVAKIKIDTYKWAAEKNAPEEYGRGSKKDEAGGITFVINTGVPSAEAITIEVERDDIRETTVNEDNGREVYTVEGDRPDHEEVSDAEGDIVSEVSERTE